jgi:outer membrane protein assembly factor BamB
VFDDRRVLKCRIAFSRWNVAVAVLLCTLLPSFAEDSPQYLGQRGDGVSDEIDWSHQWNADGPVVQWKTELGIGFSSVVTHENRVIGTGYRDGHVTVVALELETGRRIWEFRYEAMLDANDFEGGPTSTPVIDDGSVFVLSRRGNVFCLGMADGALLWEKDVVAETGIRIPGWGFSGAPRIFGKRLILNMGDAGVCLDPSSGETLWDSEDRDSGYSSAVRFEDQGVQSVILGSGRSYVCVDLETGKERWRQKWLTSFGCNAADAIVSGTDVFLSSGYSRGSALLDLSTGEPVIKWKHKDFRNQLGTSLLIDGFLYGVNGDVDAGASLSCMELQTGKIKWVADDWNAGAVIAAGDRLIAISDSGELVIASVDSEKFQVLARHQVLSGKCWVTPVMSHGNLLCRNAAGDLICLNLRR